MPYVPSFPLVTLRGSEVHLSHAPSCHFDAGTAAPQEICSPLLEELDCWVSICIPILGSLSQGRPRLVQTRGDLDVGRRSAEHSEHRTRLVNPYADRHISNMSKSCLVHVRSGCCRHAATLHRLLRLFGMLNLIKLTLTECRCTSVGC